MPKLVWKWKGCGDFMWSAENNLKNLLNFIKYHVNSRKLITVSDLFSK